MWVHILCTSPHSFLQFRSAGVDQTTISVSDIRLSSPPSLLTWAPPRKHFWSLLLTNSPLSSRISPSGIACVSPEAFATFPWETLFMFLFTILYIRICNVFLLELQVCVYRQIFSHQTKTSTQSTVILSCSSETELCVVLNSPNDLIIAGSWCHSASPLSDIVSKIGWLLLFLYAISWFWERLSPRIVEPLRREQLKLN